MRRYYDPVARVAPQGFDRAIFKKPHESRNSLSILNHAKKPANNPVSSASLLASGCVYQAALSQGNLLDQEDIDQVEVGMTRGQIRFLLGTPMIDDPFHEDRWDYIYFLADRTRKSIVQTLGLDSV